MGFSVSAVFMVLTVAVVLGVSLFTAAVLPSISTLTASINETKQKGLQTVHSRLNITGVVDGETGVWWNTSYGFRKKIDIEGHKGALTNYQVPFVIASSPHVQTSYNFTVEGLACDFPHDLRFINSSHNKELGYWIEDINEDPVTVWVKIEDDLDEKQTIFIYYGAPDVSTTSSGDNTFVFFDDFETDLSRWGITEECEDAHVQRTSTQSTGGEYSVYIYTTSVNCRAQLTKTISITHNCAFEFDWAVQGGVSEYQVFFTYVGVGGNGIGNLYAAYNTPPYKFQWYDGVLHDLTATYTDTTQWHSIQQFYDLSSDTYDIYIDGSLEQNDAAFWHATNSIGYFLFGSGAGADWGHQYVDTFKIRKWNDPEPAFAKAYSQETIYLTVEIENTGGTSVSTNDCIILVNGTKYSAKANCSYIHPLNNEKLYTTTQTPSGEKRVKLIATTNVEYYYQHTGQEEKWVYHTQARPQLFLFLL